MFIGHFAVGFSGKRIAPAVSLGTLFLAVQFLDLLWPTFLLLGWETVKVVPGITAFSPFDFVSYPYSHSLLAAVGWSILFCTAYFLASRKGRESAVLGLAVLSHWVLDFVTHRPDLPLSISPSGRRVGLGMWYNPPLTLVVEISLFLIGIIMYGRSTTAKDRAGKYGFRALIVFLFVAYFAAAFAPPPSDVTALAWGGQSVWLLVIWGYWLDRHREA